MGQGYIIPTPTQTQTQKKNNAITYGKKYLGTTPIGAGLTVIPSLINGMLTNLSGGGCGTVGLYEYMH